MHSAGLPRPLAGPASQPPTEGRGRRNSTNARRAGSGASCQRRGMEHGEPSIQKTLPGGRPSELRSEEAWERETA